MLTSPFVWLALAQATDACDRFDRPDAADPGPDWVLQYGAIGVEDLAASSRDPVSLMTHARVRTPWDQARLQCAFSSTRMELSYVALVAGYADLDASVFVKVQDDDASGDFDHVYFYRGNGGQPWSAQYRQALARPLTTGIARLHFTDDGDVAVLTIAAADGSAEEEFRCGGLLDLAPILGDGVGLGIHGAGSADDFQAGDGCSDPLLELVVSGDCGGVLTLGARGAYGEVAVLGGRLGLALQSDAQRPCHGITLALQRPVLVCVLRRDRREYSLNANGVLCGLAVQAVDLSTCGVSPPVRL